MASRPSLGHAFSEALCPDCVFPCGQAPGRGLRAPAQAPRSLAGGLVPRLPGGDVTKKRILGRRLTHSAPPPHGKAQSAARRLGRVRLSVRSDSKPRSAGPGTTRPAGWRGVARAHLPSWAIFHSAPQPGGRLPHTSRAPRRDGKAQSARRGSRRLRLSVRPHVRSPSWSRRRPLRVWRTKDVPGSRGNQMGAAVGILVLLILPRSQDSHAVPHGHISPA